MDMMKHVNDDDDDDDDDVDKVVIGSFIRRCGRRSSVLGLILLSR